MKARSDLDLLGDWRAGENAAGNELFQRHFSSVWRFFDHKIDVDVDELVQATFLACVRGRDQFQQRSSFRTYLFTIARHELYDFLRRRQRDVQAIDFSVTSLADLAMSARSRLARGQEHLQLVRALHQLPVDQQMLLELHYWEELSPSELAEVFDVPPSTVRSRLLRARQALRQAVLAQADKAVAAPESDESLDAWARALRARWSAREPGDRGG